MTRILIADDPASNAIVKRIIKVNGGKIRAEPELPWKGTTFLFTVPAARQSCTDTHNNG
jgi:signal transduction histidine kinase